ncbi:MAG: hypothetical protein ACI9F9_002357, partial [Candidatus Paceibacteria bacterium]
MNLSELVQQGWSRHDGETEDLSLQLEASLELIEPTDADGASSYMHLVNHTLGDHGADPARALRLCEAAFERLTDHGNRTPWVHLAVARHMAGEEQAALAAENELGSAAESQVRVRMLVAQGKSHAGDWEAAERLYKDCLLVA